MPWWVVAGWMLGWVLLWRLPRLAPPSSSTGDPATVSVVIPARDEADRLPILLGSLDRQDRRPDQIIVVDDGSRDGTAEVAASFPGVDVIDAPPVPAGWMGKPWACATGAATARGHLLVFLDADVELAPSALASLESSWHARGGLVSVLPCHHIRRPVEALSLPFNVVSAMGLGVGSLVPPSREWGAAGPCMITSRDDYWRVGGHGTVAGEVAEDLSLAECYRVAGLPISCLGGRDLVRYRMYRGLRGILEGWTKNLAIGAGRTPLVRSLAVVAWVTALLVTAWGLRDRPATATELLGWVLTYLAVAVQLGLLGRKVGRFGPAASAWPALMAVFVLVFVRSAVHTVVLRRVRWSGRSNAVALGRRRIAPAHDPGGNGAQPPRRAIKRSSRPRL